MSELIRRLREAAAKKWPDPHVAAYSLFSEAADEIERLSGASAPVGHPAGESAAVAWAPIQPVAWVDSLDRSQPRCVTDLKYCSGAEWDSGKHLKYIPLYTHPPRQPVRLSDEQVSELARNVDRGEKTGVWLVYAIESAVLKANGMEVKP